MRSAWQICSVSSAGSRLWCRFRRAVSTLGGRLECRAAGSRLPGFWGQAGFAAGVCMLDSFVCLCLCLCPSLSLSLSASASVSASASDSETDCAYVPAGACYIVCHKTTVCVCARARARACVCVCVCARARARARACVSSVAPLEYRGPEQTPGARIQTSSVRLCCQQTCVDVRFLNTSLKRLNIVMQM